MDTVGSKSLKDPPPEWGPCFLCGRQLKVGAHPHVVSGLGRTILLCRAPCAERFQIAAAEWLDRMRPKSAR